MGAPAGNQNAAKSRQWSAAIERAIERLGDPSIDPDQPIERSPKMKGIDQLATDFVKRLAETGEMDRFREFGDRIDGRPNQSVSGEGGGPLVIIQAASHDESV